MEAYTPISGWPPRRSGGARPPARPLVRPSARPARPPEPNSSWRIHMLRQFDIDRIWGLDWRLKKPFLVWCISTVLPLWASQARRVARQLGAHFRLLRLRGTCGAPGARIAWLALASDDPLCARRAAGGTRLLSHGLAEPWRALRGSGLGAGPCSLWGAFAHGGPLLMGAFGAHAAGDFPRMGCQGRLWTASLALLRSILAWRGE